MISKERFKAIKLIITDIDGVLTDGRVAYGAPDFIKFFNYKDGHWIRMAMRSGLMVGFLSGRKSNANEQRAAELGVTFCKEDIINKGEEFKNILVEYGVAPEECLYIGDDVIDIPVMRKAGIAVAPADAVTSVIEYVDWQTSRCGGNGVLYEVIERLLAERGELDLALARYRLDS